MEESHPHSFEQSITHKTIAYGFIWVKHPAAKTVVCKVMVPPGREIQGLEGLRKGASGALAMPFLELNVRCKFIPFMKLDSATSTLI